MANLRLWIPAIVVAATLLSTRGLSAQGPSVGNAQPQEAATTKIPPSAIVIGVVDLDRVIATYGVAVEERKRLKKLSERFGEEIKRLAAGINELRGQMSLLKVGSLEHDGLKLDLQTALGRHHGLRMLRRKQWEIELVTFEVKVYEDLDYAITRVAKDRGVAIVLRKQLMHDLRPDGMEKPGELEQLKLNQFNRRSIWYTSPEVDLTPYLIKYLRVFDARAERLKAAAAAAAAAKSEAGKSAAGKPKDGGQPNKGK